MSLNFGKVSSMVIAATLMVAPATARAPVARIVKFTNECSHPIEFIIRHTEKGDSWDSHGWYSLRPWQSSTFADGGYTLTQADGYSLYFYARATDGSGVEWSGDNRQSFGQAVYPFMEMNTAVGSDGQLKARITCD